MRRTLLPVIVTALVVASCSEGTGVIQLDDTAAVGGIAFIDRDGDGQLTGVDGLAVGVITALVREASGDTVARAVTRANGSFLMDRLPAGQYRLVALRGTAGDTVDVLHIDSARITLAARDSVTRLVRLGYPRTTTAAARALPAGHRVTMEGIALNAWNTFGDATIHFADRTGAMRSVRTAQTNLQAGDSITLIGTLGVLNGHVVLADGIARVAAPSRGLPPIDSVSTGAAATAAGGARADQQVRVVATIVDTATVSGERVLSVNDGSGTVQVVLSAQVTFNPGTYVPGATLAATGLLTPSPTGSAWRIRPRDRNEVSLSFNTVTVAQARTLGVGQQAVLQGRALNAWGAFGDSSLHIVDATGAFRAVRVPQTGVAPGDSIRLIGLIGTRDGQPVLTANSVAILQAGLGLPTPDSISTGRARTADGGQKDAAIVKVAGTIVGTSTTTLRINDGTGEVEVVFAGSAPTAANYSPGAILEATGVLVPIGNGVWRVRPRTASDHRGTLPTVSIAAARTTAVGRFVQIRGVALNGRADFGDSSVHLIDASGTIRVLAVPAITVVRGDSLLVQGVVETVNGQPVLRAAAAPLPTVLFQGAPLPAPDSVSTLVASRAVNGTRDADQFRVRGTVSASVQVGLDLLLTISDGSGDLVVRLQPAARFPAGIYKVDDVVRVSGVLVPTPTGTWELKPRAVNEIAVVGGN
jgi:DNA/RNA endonuclease YhcR with UshA esterase domain